VRIAAALLSLLVIAETSPAVAQDSANPDQLYADRGRLPSAQQAAAIWEARLKANPQDFESAWKLARACYWMGGHVASADQRAQYERGIAAAAEAVRLAPMQPEGHFWTAANMGAMAESFGLRAGLKYRAPIKRELETVLMIDPAFQAGSADRALGRWYFKVPGLFGGSKEKSVEHLQRSLMYDPQSTASRFFLAETYVDMNRKDDARRELQRVLAAPVNPEWAPEDQEFKAKAATLLTKLGN
jgi:tetratricopeptide (TPR) repeat protein